jgi:3-hydroxyacyl-CoA dehydrogenase/enoyl-CoA hydratase/3-hydroxybutyryl-CoA epimerase
VELAQEMKKPDRFVGLHFFYPVDKMPLVEVISHPSTSAMSTARAVWLLNKVEKVPISVKDSTGFLVNRLLTTHLMEASHMLDEGVPINWIEEAALRFGLPMGPFTLVDELGIPLCIDVAKRLYNSFGKRFTPPRVLHETAAAGLKGRISGAGCYLWEDGRKKELNPEFLALGKVSVSQEKPTDEQILSLQNRLIYVMIDEASRCLEEKVVRKPRELDLALVLGAGFPPFRGGLLRFADSRLSNGMGDIIDELLAIYRNSTLNFREVSSLLISMRESGRRFYSSGAS